MLYKTVAEGGIWPPQYVKQWAHFSFSLKQPECYTDPHPKCTNMLYKKLFVYSSWSHGIFMALTSTGTQVHWQCQTSVASETGFSSSCSGKLEATSIQNSLVCHYRQGHLLRFERSCRKPARSEQWMQMRCSRENKPTPMACFLWKQEVTWRVPSFQLLLWWHIAWATLIPS